MTPNSPEDQSSRELPKSLRGIEIILLYLKQKESELSSIRAISDDTGLSMRVVKNVLLQLERLNQVERVVKKNKVLPKWKITKFGRKVLKEAKGIENTVEFPDRKTEILHDIEIPKDLEETRIKIKEAHGQIETRLNDVQVELSRSLGPVLNLNDPAFEELMSTILKRIKYFRQEVSRLSSDPLKRLQVLKKGEKQKKVSKSELEVTCAEIYFFQSVLLNELRCVDHFTTNLSRSLEEGDVPIGRSIANDLREELRIFKAILTVRKGLGINSHFLGDDHLKSLKKGEIKEVYLEGIVFTAPSHTTDVKKIEEIILRFYHEVNEGIQDLDDRYVVLTRHVPLYDFYQLILDEEPQLNLTIDELERVINQLADKGHVPGIEMIQEDEDHFLKVVKLIARDYSEDEQLLIKHALKLQAFNLSDMVKLTGWDAKKVRKMLDELSDLGILKFSKSMIHGERWFIVSSEEGGAR